MNQIRNAGHELHLAEKGDFIVDNTITVEVGGKNKSNKQVSGIPNAFLVKDGLETGFLNTIPLWQFGMLY